MKPLRVPQTTLRLLQRCNHSSCNRGRTNTTFFPQNSNSRNTPKTTDWQGFSLFVLCSVENCNVAITLHLFFLPWESERSLISTTWQQSYNFAKQRIFKAFHPSARLFVLFRGAIATLHLFCFCFSKSERSLFVFCFPKKQNVPINAPYPLCECTEHVSGIYPLYQFSHIPIRKTPDHIAGGSADKTLNIHLMAEVLSWHSENHNQIIINHGVFYLRLGG